MQNDKEINFMIQRLLKIIKHPGALLYPNTYSQERYQEYLREHGVTIGNNTRFIDPHRCSIDIHRGDYITIGDNCCLSVATILAHDYSWYTLLDAYNDILPDPGGKVEIGNNCFIGYQAVILKDTYIGDNVIIGARAVVKGNIPSNTVWAGVPAKQICTLDEFHARKTNTRVEDALRRRNHIREVYQREPSIKEMGAFGMLFLKRNEENYKEYIRDVEFNGVKSQQKLREYFFNSKPIFDDYEAFLKFENIKHWGAK